MAETQVSDGKSPLIQNPFVFLLGSPRSGTTLLQRILGAHPQIAMAPESQWIPEYYKERIGLTADGRVTPALFEILATHPKARHLKITKANLESLFSQRTGWSYAQFVSGLFDAYAQTRGKPLAGDKTPNYVRQIPILHELWPQARFIHLIRDGRDVCLSMLNWKRKAARFAQMYPTWQEDPVMTAALCWERNVSQGRCQGRVLGSTSYCEIHYELLVHDPASASKKMCAFLNVAFAPSMLEYHHGRTRSEPGLSPKEAWLPITPGLRDWRSQMSNNEVQRFEAVAGGWLEELGYTRANLSLPLSLQRSAADLRERFFHALSLRRRAAVSGAATSISTDR